MPANTDPVIESISIAPDASAQRELEALIVACVAGGASIGYLDPMPPEEAAGYWRRVFGDLPHGFRILLVAREAGRIVGAVQLAAESRPNGRHRGEVQKLMVLPSHRQRGLGTQLMAAAEAIAQRRGLRLLFLDTSAGRGGACELYDKLGYIRAGGIPGYALDPDGTPAANVIYYKTLAPADPAKPSRALTPVRR